MRSARPVVFGACAALAIAALALGACSSKGRRDQYYGTDVGVNYRPPEAGVVPRDAGAETAGAVGDAGRDVHRDTAADATDATDGRDATAGMADAPTGS